MTDMRYVRYITLNTISKNNRRSHGEENNGVTVVQNKNKKCT